MTYIGELAALAAACLWAMASVIYHRVGAIIPPLALNGIKGIVSIALLLITISLVGSQAMEAETLPLLVLAASGIIGIGVGDTAFFVALKSLGERRTVLSVETLAPPLSLIIAAVTLQEFLSLGALLGLVTILFGVFWVMAERTEDVSVKRQSKAGLLWAGLAAFCQALGGVMARGVLSQTTISPLLSATVRLAGGLVFVIIALGIKRQSFEFKKVFKKQVILPLSAAIFLGTYLAIFLQQLSLQHTNAAITQTLIASSAIFVIPLVMIKGEKVSWRAIAGSVIALIGIIVLFRFK